MAPPKGNRFWEARSTHGRNPTFVTADDLWTSSLEYFEWVEENPLYESKPFAFQGVVVQEPVARMRAMTIAGLCNFLDISTTTWDNYCSKDGFLGVTTRVKQIIRQQKFEGASADLLNANIIARDLGLAEKQEHTGKDGGPIETKDTSTQEIARRLAFILTSGAQAPDESG